MFVFTSCDATATGKATLRLTRLSGLTLVPEIRHCFVFARRVHSILLRKGGSWLMPMPTTSSCFASGEVGK